ncbi:MAG TPA: LemA family protein [Gemmatimonadaceae bacterium]|nr:LemA family protein [Gemmatimonadaceae bacterium]
MLRRIVATSALAVAGVFSTGCGYNTIQSMDERVNGAQGQIEAQLQRRADLIPNLVQTVKGYAAQEERIFTEVANARSRLLAARESGDPEEMANANQATTGALGRLLAISEQYPQLKSDANFRQLQDELTGTENRIAVARTDYNGAVEEYNGYIRRFPQALTARVTGAKPRKYFQVTDPAMRQGPPQVDFSTPAAPTR